MNVDERHTQLGWEGHLLLLRRSEQERRAGVVAWVRCGLGRGEKIIYVEPAAEPPQRRLLTVLAGAGIDVRSALHDGQLQVLPATDFYPPTGHRPIVEQAIAEGYPAVRIAGEARCAQSTIPRERHLELEHEMNELCARYPVSAMCQYDADTTSGPQLDEATAVHAGFRERLMCATPRGRGLALTGEIDMSNSDLLASTVRGALEGANGEFRLDLSGVRFLDVRGVRAVQQASDAYRSRGGRLRLVARGEPALILRMLEVDRIGNLELQETPAPQESPAPRESPAPQASPAPQECPALRESPALRERDG